MKNRVRNEGVFVALWLQSLLICLAMMTASGFPAFIIGRTSEKKIAVFSISLVSIKH